MLLGKTVTITAAANNSIKGKKGKIIDETKNTITIETQNKKLTIIKSQIKTLEEHNG
jgi:RNase P/RNase MRP subunit p29